jgi:putative RNA 2'-phosphotransferase
MNNKTDMQHQIKNISKFMSLVLRHKPEEIELVLDNEGWARVDELISQMNKKGIVVDFDVIDEVVRTNDKKRFAFNEDKTRIRASQGHSIEVKLNLQAVAPPDILYHGTTEKYLESIRRTGLQKQTRQHVHLSATIETAKAVGSRHGKPVILIIDAKAMHDAGLEFYLSENNVWLTDAVPAEYIKQ